MIARGWLLTGFLMAAAGCTKHDPATAAGAKTSAGASKDEGVDWSKISDSGMFGDLRVSITSAALGNRQRELLRGLNVLDVDPEKIEDEKEREEFKKGLAGLAEAKNDLMLIGIRIENRSATRKLDCRGWGRDLGESLEELAAGKSPAAPASASDEIGNSYAHVGEAHLTGAIYPGESLQGTLYFEPPVDPSKPMRMTLSGQRVGIEMPIRLKAAIK